MYIYIKYIYMYIYIKYRNYNIYIKININVIMKTTCPPVITTMAL